MILHEAAMYFDKMDTYGVEDLIQECNIVAWQVIASGNFKGGKFSTYFGGAIRNRLCNIYRDYNLKNLVCIGEQEDYHGNITRILVESDYAREYRIKKNEDIVKEIKERFQLNDYQARTFVYPREAVNF